jgi:hypothetical protein
MKLYIFRIAARLREHGRTIYSSRLRYSNSSYDHIACTPKNAIGMHAKQGLKRPGFPGGIFI